MNIPETILIGLLTLTGLIVAAKGAINLIRFITSLVRMDFLETSSDMHYRMAGLAFSVGKPRTTTCGCATAPSTSKPRP